jgi:hypothetical protein
MKKLILSLIIFVALVGTTNAQDKKLQIKTGNSITGRVTFNAADTLSVNKTSYTIEFEAPQNYPSIQSTYLEVDSIAGTPSLTTHLLGSLWGTTWVAISDTLTWNGSGATKVIETNNTNTVSYRIFRQVINLTGTGVAKTAVTDSKLKLFFK